MNRRYVRVPGLCLVLALCASSLAAQQAPEREEQRPESARFYFGAGWATLDLDELNGRLAAQPEPYSAFPEDMLALGVGGHVRFQRFLLGGEGQALIATDEADFSDQRRARLSGFFAALTLGYAVVATPALDVYPLLQLGGGGVSMEIEERGDQGFDEVLSDPGLSTTITNSTFLGGAGLGLDYAFGNGLLIGVRGSYNVTPGADNWKGDERDILGGPDVELTGPVLRVMVGFGGRGRR